MQKFLFAVSICHLERHRDDGRGGFVCPHTRCSFTSHASRVQHDDRHVCSVWARTPRDDRPKQGMQQQHHLLDKWLHIWNSWKWHCVLWVRHKWTADVVVVIVKSCCHSCNFFFFGRVDIKGQMTMFAYYYIGIGLVVLIVSYFQVIIYACQL